MAKANPVDVQKHLGGMDYPASKADILQRARQQGAEKEVMSLLQQLPEREYNKPTDVSHEIGEIE